MNDLCQEIEHQQNKMQEFYMISTDLKLKLHIEKNK